ncbi:MAG TPA: hypothetical protein VL126_01205 [Bacteroidota bacterium]|nr:hypothetical protein [Bacteroidota bacterium]
MTDNATIWKAMEMYLPKRTWIPLSDILATVQARIPLDQEDLERLGSRSGSPRWESNVRRVLRTKARTGNLRSRKSQRDQD